MTGIPYQNTRPFVIIGNIRDLSLHSECISAPPSVSAVHLTLDGNLITNKTLSSPFDDCVSALLPPEKS